jgi:hypothetical protein
MKKIILIAIPFFFIFWLDAVTAVLEKKEKFNFDPAVCQRLSDAELAKLCKKNSVNLIGITKEQFERFVAYASTQEPFDALKNFSDLPIFFSIAQQLKLSSLQEEIINALVDYFQNSIVLKEYQDDPYLIMLAPLKEELLAKVVSRLVATNQLTRDIFRFVPFRLTPIQLGEDLSLYFVNAAFDPAGKLLAFVEEVGSIVVIDTNDGSVKYHLKVEREDMPHMVGAPLVFFSPTGDRIVRATESGVLYAWETATGRLIKKINYNKQIVAAAFFKSGAQLLAADEDNTLIIFDWKTGNIKAARTISKKPVIKQEESAFGDISLKEIKNIITHVAIDRRGAFAAIAFYDTTIEIWSMGTLEKVASIDTKDDIVFMDFIGSQLELVTKPADLATALKNIVTPVDVTITRAVYELNPSGQPELKESRAIKTKMVENALSYDQKRKRCVLLGSNFATELWNLETGEKIATLGTSIEGVPLALNPVKDQLLSMQIGQQMNLVDLSELGTIKNELEKLNFTQAIFLQIVAHEVAAYRSVPLDKAPWKTMMNSFSLSSLREAIRQYATVPWWKKPTQKFIDTVNRFFSGAPGAEK